MDNDDFNYYCELIESALGFCRSSLDGEEVSSTFAAWEKIKEELKGLNEAMIQIDECTKTECKLCSNCIMRVSTGKPKAKSHLSIVKTDES